jgi:prepilin-type N-terminal cleavage/methylation domain-containing protein
MLGTSACLPHRVDARPRARGFTLLELLVVLALAAMLTALVVPAAVRGLDAARERGVAADLTALLAGLPVRAYKAGVPAQFDAVELMALMPEMPAGWRLQLTSPLRYSAAGVAEGGDLVLHAPGRSGLRWQVVAGTGAVNAPN